ncbi:MAG: CBS domain-containing protein [Chloroflexi bacterium]|nr:CBS domain-containing protein [Chloroflexota bacterium]
MQPYPPKVIAEASLEEVAKMMEEQQTRYVCVCDDEGLLVGTITLDQIACIAPDLAGKVLQATANQVPAMELTPATTAPRQRLKATA